MTVLFMQCWGMLCSLWVVDVCCGWWWRVGDDGAMVMGEVIVVEGGGWERVLRVIDDAHIEHWLMLTPNLGAEGTQVSGK